MQPLLPEDPRRVGGHRLLARLGAGGTSTVYLGCSPGGRTVAVKVVREHLARDARYRARFAREVAAARGVTGVFTAPLLDADPEAAVPWLVTAHLPGPTLREAVAGFGPFPVGTAYRLAAALAEALVDLYGAGLAHRDLKPANIVLTADGPRVIDFGVARAEHATAFTLPGAVPGTPGFMSPEQASGGLAGPPGDVFALGTVLAYAATGRELFAAGSRAATLERVRLARPDLGALGDAGLRALVADCLRREPERRPTAAAVLERAAALRDRLEGPEALVRGTGWLPAPLAEAVAAEVAARRAELARLPPGEGGSGQPEQRGTDGARASEGDGGLPSDETTEGPVGTPAPGPGDAGTDPGPRRRGLLAVAVAVPAGAGAALLAERAFPGHDGTGDGRTDDGGSGAEVPDAGRYPEAVRRWRRRVLTGGGPSDSPSDSPGPPDNPELYAAGGVVLAAQGARYGVHALDPRTGRVLWSRRPSGADGASRVAVGPDTAYLLGSDGERTAVLRAVEPASGATRWTHRLPPGSPGAGAGVAAGPVFCLAGEGEVAGLDAGDGERRWTARVTGLDLTADDGLVVAAGDGVLTGVDAEDGRVRWTRATEEPPLRAVLGGDLVAARDTYGTLYALRARDGSPVWRRALHYRSSVWPAAGGLLHVDEADGRVRALRARDGAEAWSRRFGRGGRDPHGGSYLLGRSGGVLWVGGPDRRVYALDASDGRVLWTYAADATYRPASRSGAGVLAVGGRVLVGTAGGQVEAVDPPAAGDTGTGTGAGGGAGGGGTNGGARGGT
ncbi:PQQ-binding-like beta-propeller repeat protein [Streptomyces sp. Z26]|uniref:outer membrane protein assembly factor BamB family protein n=1 Tax=Streptomyces sp. Z26 TaxID=2500177 RepID=UPI001404345C|nr:PQQ-binding-like beta-propeller repeat protein [Streptomyces sp. Z26]